MFVSLGGNCSISYQLNKHGLRNISFPFDWCNITINQLIEVLSNNFLDFENVKIKKKSLNHLDFKNNEPSYILVNKYNVKFAHELLDENNINEFIEKIKRRVERFKKLDNCIFIRLELQNLSNIQFEIKYRKLNKIILEKFNSKLIIISKNINFEDETNNIIFYKFENFSDDWKMNSLDWLNIFNIL